MNTNKLPAGRYVGRAQASMSLTNTTSKAGADLLRVAIPVGLLNEGYEDRTITWFGNFGASEKTDNFALKAMRAMGWSATALGDPTGLGSVDVDVVISYSTYNGKERMDVTVWAPGGGSGGGFVFDNPAPVDAVAAFNARLAGKLAATAPAGGAPPPPFVLPGAPTQDVAGGPTDPIPF